MTDLYRNKWVAGGLLIFILSLLATCNYMDHLRHRATVAEDRASLAQAQIAGLNEALAAKPKEVVKLVEVTKVVEKLIKDGTVKPVAAAKVETSTKEVPLPTCPDPLKSEDDSFTSPSVSKGNLIKAESLGVQTRFDLFIGLAGGKPIWTGQAQTDLTAPNYRQAVAWSNEELVKAGSQVTFSEDILKALQGQRDKPSRFALLPRNWRHWRFGPVAGAGAAYNPADGRLTGAVFVGYAISF